VDLGLQRKRFEKVWTTSRHGDLRRALRHKVLPAVEHLPILAGLPEMALVLDVGANVGQFASVARHRWPHARIVSFEPLPDAAQRLRALFADDPRFECREVALTDHAGTDEFHVTGHDDSSSLLRVAARQVAEFATDDVAVLQVTTARLDDVVPPSELPDGPILLKLDTQGTELDVLRGGAGVLARATHLVVEVSFVELYEGQASAADVTRHLVEHGWDLVSTYDVKASRRTGEPLQADALFARRVR
jgi:FkbM family methyltransferase